MSGGPINSARSRSTSGRRGRHNSVDLACDVTPVLDAGHTRSISPQDSIHVAASSHYGKQKGRDPNKQKRAARRPDERPDERLFIQIAHKGTFLDVEKRLQVWELFKTHYQWGLEDEKAVRKAFLRSMKKGWGDNMKDERDKWRANGEYRPRGKKNRASGERVTHTTGSVSFDVHEEQMTKAVGGVRLAHQELYKETHILRKGVPQGQEAPWCGDKHKTRHDTFVSECSATYGSDSASWPPRDNDAWAIAVGGCQSNIMPGIDMTKKQAKDREAMQMMRDEIGQVKEQREVMQRMLEDMGRMQASLSQQFAAFSAYGMRSPSATPSFPYTGQAFPLVGTSFPIARPSFHANGPSFPHAMPMKMPIEATFPIGQMGRQSRSPGTSSANPPQDDYGYQPRFDVDYQGPFGPE
ncbi:hypothetical protein SLEP1_g28075 [Rubroshorea leprosula]|uniref:Uncharacterized protein n=1 Tax=Rubroshorea leprosula TaxID=152421 RepID=A0AAV5K3Y0_9ROSI|nr:hypothetical protein SLEP1_g28075 [Rubroshorea leprosula]